MNWSELAKFSMFLIRSSLLSRREGKRKGADTEQDGNQEPKWSAGAGVIKDP